MTRKKTKQAKGLSQHQIVSRESNECGRAIVSIFEKYGPIPLEDCMKVVGCIQIMLRQFVLLDASDAGREALQIDLTKIFADWLFRSESKDLPMEAVMRRLGFPKPGKGGKAK